MVDEVALILTLLSEMNYRPEQLDRNRIKIVQGGVAATIMIYEDTSLSMRCLVEGGEDFIFELADVNDANYDMRFGKFAISNQSLLLECDFVFEPVGSDARERLTHIMKIWDANLVRLRELVANSRQPA
ncbi:hypothetical protein [Sphingomonas sp. TWP1-3-1]|uniref:hypothetical protein n=1 Tax=Sphingomonas sp. TWP1-3-1 TaxID=2804612 RepID=UPI003CF19896